MINTNRGIMLGSLKEENLFKYMTWRNMPGIMRWCRQDKLIAAPQQRKWFERVLNDPSIIMYEIVSLAGPVVGVCGLTDIDATNRRAEFSLYIAPEYQRKGFAKAGLCTLLDYGFEMYNLNLIWGETFETNPALHVFKRLGMKEEGLRRQFYFKNGKYIDCHLVSITRDEWRALNK